jgi:hypothetical protein
VVVEVGQDGGQALGEHPGADAAQDLCHEETGLGSLEPAEPGR